MPSSPDQSRAEKALQAQYRQEYAKPLPADQRALAVKLIGASSQAKTDPALQYVHLREARDLAAQAGHADWTLLAIEALAMTFAVDVKAERTKAAAALSRTAVGPQSFRAFAESCLKFALGDLRNDEYDEALHLLSQAEGFARRAQDPAFASAVAERSREAAALRREFDRVKPSFRTLQDKPEDPQANLAVGRFRCFMKQEWEAGLPLLARSSEDALRALAQKDLEGAGAPVEGQVALAESWWMLGEKPGAAKGRTQPWWTLVQGTVMAPADAVSAEVYIHQSFTRGTLWVDDVSLKGVDDGLELVENGGFEQRS